MGVFAVLFLLIPVALVIIVVLTMTMVGGVMLVELLGAIRAIEFMALAGNGKQGNSH